jgi:hypothetical protein
LLISRAEQLDAKYRFYQNPNNRNIIKKNFLSISGALPDAFSVLYDPNRFEHSSLILLRDSDSVNIRIQENE